MPLSQSSSCRVLTYGIDEVLLKTRQTLLGKVGIKTDLMMNEKEFLGCITASERRYNLFIICHSVPLEEQQVIIQSASGSDAEIYAIRDFVFPDQFLKDVQKLTESC